MAEGENFMTLCANYDGRMLQVWRSLLDVIDFLPSRRNNQPKDLGKNDLLQTKGWLSPWKEVSVLNLFFISGRKMKMIQDEWII
jgi:hypothetical protein